MEKPNALSGHLFAIVTVVVWGTTFIVTKLLLRSFNPAELMLYRFTLAYAALWVAAPRPLKLRQRAHEWYFAVAGLSGVALYQLLENLALTLSPASNVSLIVSTTPLFTAIAAHFLLGGERLRPVFFVGFVCAIFGIGLITLGGSLELRLSPTGDLLALGAALCWSAYSITLKKLGALGYPAAESTRRIFFYGVLFTLPSLLLYDTSWDFGRFADPANLTGVLYLGVVASAVCFGLWNRAIGLLGAVKASSYIYAVPVVTMVASAFVLDERVTAATAVGALLTLGGLVLSELRFRRRAI